MVNANTTTVRDCSLISSSQVTLALVDRVINLLSAKANVTSASLHYSLGNIPYICKMVPLKILIVRFSSIGDIVLTTPVPRCLKKQLGVTVHYLTKASYQTILAENPYIDHIYTIKKEITEILPQLKLEKYDLIVDLHHNLRTLRLKLSLGVKSSAFHKLNVEKWLLTNFKINRLPKLHIVDRYLETVKHLGVINDGAGLDYFIKEKDRSFVNALKKRTPYYIVFALGGKFATKRLPTTKIIAICKQLDYPTLLIGGKEDLEIGEAVCKAVNNRDDKILAGNSNLPPKLSNLCGKLSLGGSAALIEEAACLLTHDTGMMHIGAALGRPIVSIWGNTAPAFGMTPFFAEGKGAHILQEVVGLTCRPCSKIGHAACPKGHFKCMEEQDVKKIVASVRDLIY